MICSKCNKPRLPLGRPVYVGPLTPKQYDAGPCECEPLDERTLQDPVDRYGIESVEN